MPAASSASLHRRCCKLCQAVSVVAQVLAGVSVGIYRGQTAQPPAHFERDQQSRRSVQKMIFSVHAPTRKNLIDAIAPRFLGCRTASERLEEHLRAAGVPIPEQAAPSFRNDAVHRYEIAFTPGGAWPGGAVFSRVEQEFLDMCDYSLHSV